jgi:hypothetical protein
VVEKNEIWYGFFLPLCSSLGFSNQLANLQQFPATLSSTPWCKPVHESDERERQFMKCSGCGGCFRCEPHGQSLIPTWMGVG